MRIINDEHYEELYRGYPLDAAQIGDVSIDKRSIKLPYSGELPCNYDRAEISFIVRPHYVSVALHIYDGDSKHEAFGIEADRDEIAKTLERFFFLEREPNVLHTRTNNGLTRYWNAYKQAEFQLWEAYTQNPAKLIAVARQLDAAQRESLVRELQRLA